jgi:hypothetical protein
MNTLAFRALAMALCLAPAGFSKDVNVDIRNGVPTSAHMAVYGQRNPEREYMRPYQQEIWKTIQDEKLPERVFRLMMEAIPTKSKESVESVSDELRTIFDPLDWSTVVDTKELAYGQVMEVPQTHHLLILRLPSNDTAATLEAAVIRMGEMIERRSDKSVVGVREDVEKLAVYSLRAKKIKDFPFQPAFARIGDVVAASSSAKVLRESVRSLLAGGPSKFDDPRLQGALKKLPKAEDALVFYDARQQFRQMKEIGNFIREKAPKDVKAVRFARVFERVMNEVDILDYQVAVEYTEGNRNLKTELLQMMPESREKTLHKVFATGKPFENWERWVPADAQAYSLHTGANLHALYEFAMQFIEKEFPEAKPKLVKFEEKQLAWGIHIDREILQAFSGESVKIKLPATSTSVLGGQDTVIALRCEKPKRIWELIHQGIEKLGKSAYGQSQQLKLVSSKDIEGFDELSANLLMAFGLHPVIGIHEGWVIVATNPTAARKVLKTLSGDSPSIVSTERFKRFGMDVKGPVVAIRYSDIGASIRQAAMLIRQAGFMAPAFILSAGVKDAKTLKVLQDATGLLPSIANVVEKFNFLDGRLTVAQKDASGSYIQQTVTLVRKPTAEK